MIIPETLAIHAPKKELLNIINNKKFKDKILFKKKSNFHDIKVVENEIGRFLHYSNTYQAGIIKTEYYKGNLPYINYFLLPYLCKKNIKKVLLIGLGSGKIVNDLFKLYPNISCFDIVDIEENIIAIAQKYFNFNLNKNSHFHLQDAFVYLKENKKKYDLIIVDVANNDGIEERFLKQEYFDLVKSRLKKSGLFISNICSSPDLYNKKNIFFKKIKKLYAKNFYDTKIFKGDYSDKIYYKSFFNIDERVIDITNLILISSNTKIIFDTKQISNFNKLIPEIDLQAILNDIVIQNSAQDSL